MNKQNQHHRFHDAKEHLLDEAQDFVSGTERLIQRASAPVEQHVFKRFPVLFMLATTFGFTMVILSAEQLLLSSWFGERPVVSLLIGTVILIATGTAYKKL